MARYPLQFQSTDQNGKIIVGATVTITETGGTTAVVSYAASSGGADVAGVYTTDEDGRIKAWLDTANYTGADYFRVAVTGARFKTQTMDDIIIMPITSLTEATIALDNLVAVAINTSLVSDTADTDDLGTEAKPWKKLYLGTGGIAFESVTQNGFQQVINVIDPTEDRQWTIPNSTDIFVGRNTPDTLVDKTLTQPTIGDLTNMTHTHSSAASGGQTLSQTVMKQIIIADQTDTTKNIQFSIAGATTDKTLTLQTLHTADRTVKFPDQTTTLVGRDTTDVLENKTSIDIGGTVLYGSRAITVDTGGVLNIVLASAAGDDFTVDTDKFVVEGDTGNVGVGVLDPANKFSVAGGIRIKSADARLISLNSDAAYAVGSSGGSAIRFITDAANDEIAFETHKSGTSHAERMRIDSIGQVGIGVVVPLAGLQVYGSGEQATTPSSSANVGGAILIGDSGAGTGNGGKLILGSNAGGTAQGIGMIKAYLINGTGNSNGHMDFYTRHAAADANMTHRIRITSTGNVGIGSTALSITNQSTMNPTLWVSGSSVQGSFQAIRHTTPGGGGAGLLASSTRGADANTHTILQDGDGCGHVGFNGSDGVQYLTGGLIKVKVSGTPGVDDMPTDMTFETNNGSQTSTEVMKLDLNGELSLNIGTLELSDGGTVSQITNRSTAVTLNTYSGQITTHTASLGAGLEAAFTVNNSQVTGLDVVVVSIASGRTSTTGCWVSAVGAGSFQLTVANHHGSTAETGAIVINYVVLRGAAS